jgi:hypothetical protein
LYVTSGAGIDITPVESLRESDAFLSDPWRPALTEDEFWLLIEASRKSTARDRYRQEENLRQLLAALPVDEIFEFELRYGTLIRQAYNWDLWAAAYIIQGGCGDDMFWDFRSWLVAQGKDIYYSAVDDPDSLTDVISLEDDRWIDFENPAMSVWEEKTGESGISMPCVGSNLGEEPEGKPWTDEELPERLPRLWRKFGALGGGVGN